MKTDFALVRLANPICCEQSVLNRRAEVTEAVPKDSEILVAIRDASATDIDAADYDALRDDDVVEREVAVCHDRIRREGQRARDYIPDLTGGPAMMIGCKIADVD